MSSDIKKLSEQVMNEAVPIFKNFAWEDKAVYSNWLAQTYFVTSHSTRLLAASACRLFADEQALHVRFMDHGREEKGHHIVAGRDLANLGFDIENYEELSLTKAFVHSQYFQIEKYDPTCLFGYIICLEGLAARAGNYAFEKAARAHGENCAKFLKLHGAEDIEHVEEAFTQVEKLDDRRRDLIAKNLIQTCDLYLTLLKSLEELAASGKVSRKFGT